MYLDDNLENFVVINNTKYPVFRIQKCRGFVYNGNAYIYIKDCMNLLGYHRFSRDGAEINEWNVMHDKFYSAMHQLRFKEESYPIPLCQERNNPNNPGPTSEYEIDLPKFILDCILVKIMEKKRDKSQSLLYLHSIISKFKDIKNIVPVELEILHQDASFIGVNEMGNDKIKNLHQDASFNNNEKINILECPLSNQNLNGFVNKENMIFINSSQVGFMIGLTMPLKENPMKGTIRWNLYYKFYIEAVANLGEKYNKSYNLGKNDFRKGSSERGPKSKYEQLMPEYIPLLVAYAIANNLHNPVASNFRLEVIMYALPFFLTHAPKEQQDQIEFVRNVRPLLDERERQLNAKRQQQISQQQYAHVQYMYFNQNTQGMRPAIPNYNPNIQFTGMAYQLADPNLVQKKLDSQTGLKEVVVFGDKAKAMK